MTARDDDGRAGDTNGSPGRGHEGFHVSDKRRIVVNTLMNGAAQFASMASALVFMPLLVRAFGLTNYGLYLLAGSVASYAALLDLGVGTALTKMVAEKSVDDPEPELGRLVSAALSFYIVVGVVVAIALVTVGVFSRELFRVDAAGAQLVRNLFFLAGAFSLWGWPAATAMHVLAGRQRYTVTAGVSLGIVVGNAAAIVAVLLTHEGPFALMVMSGFISVAGTLVNIVFARRELGGAHVSPSAASLPALRSIFLFSWAVFVVQVATIIVYQQTDRLVLGIFLGASAITLYEAAGKFQGVVAQITGFATSAVVPLASRMDAEKRHSSLQTLFLRGTKYTAALIAPVVVTLMVLAEPLLRRWLGPEFVSQTTAARVIVFPQLLLALGPVGDSIIVGQGKLPKRIPYVIGITLGNLAISLALVRPLGILGVIIGTTVPYLIDFPLHMRFLLVHIGLPAKRWLREVVAPVYPLLVVPFAVSVALLRTPLMDRLLGVGLAALLSVVAYWIALYAFGLSSSEREEVRAALASARRRFGPSKA